MQYILYSTYYPVYSLLFSKQKSKTSWKDKDILVVDIIQMLATSATFALNIVYCILCLNGAFNITQHSKYFTKAFNYIHKNTVVYNYGQGRGVMSS